MSRWSAPSNPLQHFDNELKSTSLQHDPVWPQNLAVGHKDYVEPGSVTSGRVYGAPKVGDDAYTLRKPVVPYTIHMARENSVFDTRNTVLLEQINLISLGCVSPALLNLQDCRIAQCILRRPIKLVSSPNQIDFVFPSKYI